MIKIRNHKDLLNLKRDEHVEEVYIARRLSKNLITILLTLFPNLKRIYIPKSLANALSPRIRDALNHVGVEVVATGRGPGRPSKYTEETLKLIVEKYKSGEKVSEISRSLGIPLRTLYYLLRRMGLRRKDI